MNAIESYSLITFNEGQIKPVDMGTFLEEQCKATLEAIAYNVYSERYKDYYQWALDAMCDEHQHPPCCNTKESVFKTPRHVMCVDPGQYPVFTPLEPKNFRLLSVQGDDTAWVSITDLLHTSAGSSILNEVTMSVAQSTECKFGIMGGKPECPEDVPVPSLAVQVLVQDPSGIIVMQGVETILQSPDFVNYLQSYMDISTARLYPPMNPGDPWEMTWFNKNLANHA